MESYAHRALASFLMKRASARELTYCYTCRIRRIYIKIKKKKKNPVHAKPDLLISQAKDEKKPASGLQHNMTALCLNKR